MKTIAITMLLLSAASVTTRAASIDGKWISEMTGSMQSARIRIGAFRYHRNSRRYYLPARWVQAVTRRDRPPTIRKTFGSLIGTLVQLAGLALALLAGCRNCRRAVSSWGQQATSCIGLTPKHHATRAHASNVPATPLWLLSGFWFCVVVSIAHRCPEDSTH